MLNIILLTLKNLFLILLTVSEVYLTVFLVKKFIEFEEKINEIHRKFIVIATEVLIINDKIIEIIKKLNKVLNFITNKRVYQTISILKTIFNTAQIILLIRSFDYSKNKNIFNYKNMKKLVMSEVIRRITRKIIFSAVKLV